jgi:hypothetical protein
MDRQFGALYGYLALARHPGNSGALDDRSRLMVRQLAAERIGCRCIDRARHDWRAAGLPVDLLRRLDRHDPDAGLSERATAELIARMADHHLFADDHT